MMNCSQYLGMKIGKNAGQRDGPRMPNGSHTGNADQAAKPDTDG